LLWLLLSRWVLRLSCWTLGLCRQKRDLSLTWMLRLGSNNWSLRCSMQRLGGEGCLRLRRLLLLWLLLLLLLWLLILALLLLRCRLCWWALRSLILGRLCLWREWALGILLLIKLLLLSCWGLGVLLL